MKKWLIILLVIFAATAQAVEVVDPAEIAPGATGVCVTEMDGGERVEIPLTVIGTVGPWTPEGEIVLVRLDDDRFRHTGPAHHPARAAAHVCYKEPTRCTAPIRCCQTRVPKWWFPCWWARTV